MGNIRFLQESCQKNMKKLTVTVAISAKNEELSIYSLLKSVLAQNNKYYTLSHIVVASDGSTDGTVSAVKSLKSSKIILREYNKSLGKAQRLGQIYRLLTTNLVVQLDADIKLQNSNFIDNLVKPFTKDDQLGMTGANSLPASPLSFVSSAIAASTRPYIYLRRFCPSLSIGPALSLRSELARKISFPRVIIGEDIFTYFTCLTLGYKYQYAKNAVLTYVLPQTLAEHIAQNVRFLKSPTSMHKYFDSELIEKEDYIPKTTLLIALSKEIITHPVLAIYIFIVNLYCRLRAMSDNVTIKSSWSVATTTKKISI